MPNCFADDWRIERSMYVMMPSSYAEMSRFVYIFSFTPDEFERFLSITDDVTSSIGMRRPKIEILANTTIH